MKRFKILISCVAVFIFIVRGYAQVPDIVKVDKRSGSYGELVTISGSGFSSNKSTLNVYFGSSKGQILNSTEYLIEVLVPGGATYQNISVINLNSRATGYSKNYFNLAFNGNSFDESRINESTKISEDNGLFDLCNCDFNGDGLNDVAATNNRDESGASSITVYQNITQISDFDMKFNKINEVNLNIGKGARNLTCADLDGDGKPELIVGKGGGNADRIYIFKNTSGSAISFDPFITILLSENVSSSTTRRLKIHDMDKDGKPDIIMTDQGTGKVFIFANKSSSNGIDFPSSARQSIATTAGSLVGLDVADLNNDNKPEIVCNSDKSEIFIIPNQSVAGTIIMGEPQSRTIAGSNLVNLKIGDLDNDGDKDIAVTNLVNNIYVLVNTGSKDSYTYSSPQYIETGRAPWGLDFGDINGDGMVDIVVATTDASDKLTALINTSSETNLSYDRYDIGNSDISFNVNISDFNADGKPDVGYVNRQNNELIFLRNMLCVISEISPDNPPPICSNKPVKLKTTPALKVDYIWKNTVTDQVIPGNFQADIIQPGTYNVTIQSQADGCDSQSEEVIVSNGGDNLPPTVSIISPGVVCEGSNFKLTAALINGVTYYWETPSDQIITGNEITITNAGIDDGGRYALVLESAGCRTDPVTALVEISAIPLMEISSSSGTLFCEGTSNELSVPLVPQATYIWKLNNNEVSGINGNIYPTTASGAYTVSVKNNFDCTSTSNSISINEVEEPIAQFSEVASSCLNEPIQFENTSSYDNAQTPRFLWDFGDGVNSSDKNPVHTYTKSGDFKVILEVGYDNTVCRDVSESFINVDKFLNLEIMVDEKSIPDGEFNLCDGNSAELSVIALEGQIQWSTGETTPKINISSPGIYSVSSGSDTGCSSKDEMEAVGVDNVNLEITSGSQRIESGSSAQLGAEGADTYAWDPEEDLDDPTIPNPLASPIVTTEYIVTGSNIYGCEDSKTVTVFVDEKVKIPVEASKAFTPNGDGINDIWEIRNIDVFESCPIRIFNRRGQNVYEAGQYNNDWNGMMGSKELPEGAYYYILSCSSSEVHTGNVTLIR